jgi:hypothetical protein
MGVMCARWLAITCCSGRLRTYVKESKSKAGDVIVPLGRGMYEIPTRISQSPYCSLCLYY